MKLNHCHLCGFSFYSKKEETICAHCKEEADSTYQAIVDYLKKYPNSNALQISDALHIPAYTVLTYVENGQLEHSRGHFEQLPD